MLFALAPSVRLYYPFRYRDPRTGKWVRARYVAEPHVIAERHAEWEVTGPAEIRTRGGGGSFNPFRGPITPAAHLPIEEPPDEPPPEKAPDEDDHPVEEPPPVEDRLEPLPLAHVFAQVHHLLRAPATIRCDEWGGPLIPRSW